MYNMSMWFCIGGSVLVIVFGAIGAIASKNKQADERKQKESTDNYDT